jgi:hypothetical protein
VAGVQLTRACVTHRVPLDERRASTWRRGQPDDALWCPVCDREQSAWLVMNGEGVILAAGAREELWLAHEFDLRFALVHLALMRDLTEPLWQVEPEEHRKQMHVKSGDGVVYYAATRRWRATLRTRYLGSFRTRELAVQARLSAEAGGP